MMTWAKNNGYIIYDMGGTNPFDPYYANIDKFKSSFNGRLVTNYVIYRENFYINYLMRIKKYLDQ